MARLAHVPEVFHRIGFLGFARRVWHEVTQDNLLVWAAALAYAWLFAVFPFFIFLLSLLPFLPVDAKEAAAVEVSKLLHTLPDQAAAVLWENVQSVISQPRRGLLGAGIFVALWAASGGMSWTMAAVERCYEIQRGRPVWRQRPLALLLTIIVASLILAVLVLLPIGTVVTRWLAAQSISLRWLVNLSRWLLAAAAAIPLLLVLYRVWRRKRRWGPTAIKAAVGLVIVAALALVPLGEPTRQWLSEAQNVPGPLLWLLNLARWSLALVLLFAIVGIVYYFGPNIRQRFHVLSPGAVFCVAVWIVLGVLFRAYVNTIASRSYNETYGTVGGVAILLLFFYIDAVVLLVGAEINSEIDFEMLGVPRGSRDFLAPALRDEGETDSEF